MNSGLVSRVRELAAEGHTRREIAEILDCSYNYVSVISSEQGISIRREDRVSRKRRDQISRLAEQGYNREEIARELGLGVGYVGTLAKKNGIAVERKPFEPSKIWDSSDLEEAIDNSLTLVGGGKILGVTTERFRQVLNETGRYGEWEEKRRANLREKKGAIRQVLDLGTLSHMDIAYFIEASCQLLRKVFPLFCSGLDSNIRRFSTGHMLTYRVSSKIYQATDNGGITGKPQEVVDYALERRAEISPPIIEALDILWPKERQDKPYRS